MTSSLSIQKIITKARAAQAEAEHFTQEQVRDIARGFAWIANENAEAWARMNYEDVPLGDLENKVTRIKSRPKGVLKDLLEARTVGVIEEDEIRGLVKIAKPVGVVAGILPMTVPVASPIIKAMNALACRNAIVLCAHPSTKRVSNHVIHCMREVLGKLGAPVDLVQCIEHPSKELSMELMRQSDLIIATGGAGLVKAAYSSGTPAYGVGVGNAVSVIDETADLDDAAQKVMESQVNDLATGCSTENALLIQSQVYETMVAALISKGAHLISESEKPLLQAGMWKDGKLNPDIIARPAAEIARIAGLEIDPDRSFIIVPESGVGPDHPFSGEKLSVVLSLYKYEEFQDAIDKTNEIQSFMGAGHSCGIHSFDDDHIREYALKTKTSRVMIRQPQNKGNAGNFSNGMPFTITLGCGTWGGNITTENITYKHYMNVTWVSQLIPSLQEPSDESLFGNIGERLN
jgi:sulfoacetaldehyde dehydrogenase